MKLLLLLAFVASAYSAYFEPGESVSRQKRHYVIQGEPQFGHIYGEPHIYTMDGRNVSYQGHCTYIIMRDNCQDGYPNGLSTFTVYGDFYLRTTSDFGTFLKQVYIEVAGKLIKMKVDRSIYVDGVQVPSTGYDSSGIRITGADEYSQYVYFDFGMTIHTHNWGSPLNGKDLWILLTDDFKTKVCGVLGNFNDDPSDDMVIGPHCPCVLNYKPGTLTDDYILFGESWKSDKFGDSDSECDMDACATTPPGGIPHPCRTPAMRENARRQCSPIFDPNGSNRECLSITDQSLIDFALDDCIYDVCATGDSSIVNLHNATFVDNCILRTGTTKTCTLKKGGLLNTFDGLNLEITKEQKTALARYDPSSTDTCRFEVRAVTTFDCAWERPPQLLPLLVDWIGVSCDKKTRGYFGRRNILLTQQTNQVRIRGKEKLTVTSFPYSLSLSDGSAVTIERATVGGQVEFRVRSSAACQWGVNWRPDTRDSEADIFFGGNYGGQMEGMCGDADGDMANDWKKCNGRSVTPGPAGTNQITDSCREGKNQGQGIEGCNKTK